MVDLHSHILYGIDDGSKSIEESLEILRNEVEFGVTDVVLTPHYIKDSKYNANNKTKEKIFMSLQEAAKEANININLYLGNEVYIDEGITKLLRKEEIKTINNTKYVLVELPLNHEYMMLDEVLDELLSYNLVPILAHPERYSRFQGNFDYFDHLIRMGCLLQGNIGSLSGKYGKNAKKMLQNLLKRDMITVIGTDIHHAGSSILDINVEKCLKKIVKDQSKVEDLLINNARKILKSRKICE